MVKYRVTLKSFYNSTRYIESDLTKLALLQNMVIRPENAKVKKITFYLI